MPNNNASSRPFGQPQPLPLDLTMQVMFKYGDDLRQDNLVLQLFKLMEKLWIDDNLNLEMMAYSILEIGYQIGYLEFVD